MLYDNMIIFLNSICITADGKKVENPIIHNHHVAIRGFAISNKYVILERGFTRICHLKHTASCTIVLMHHSVPMNGFHEGTKFHRLQWSHVHHLSVTNSPSWKTQMASGWPIN